MSQARNVCWPLTGPRTPDLPLLGVFLIMLSRFKSAARILLKGDPKKKSRNPIPANSSEII